MSDEDEFDALFPPFTAEDLEQIDLAFALAQSETNSQNTATLNGPLISIEVEGDDILYGPERRIESPYARYRKWQKSLSVSDIVSPAWCEVQFYYGLQQRRFLPLNMRPTAFVTPAGKEVKVSQKVAVKNDMCMTAGRVVHKKLEEEVHKEMVPVETRTREDRWALRLLDFLVRMQSLKLEGFCRELPVSGVIEDQLITGIVDEIRVAQPSAQARAHSEPPLSRRLNGPPAKGKQNAIDNYFLHQQIDGKSSPKLILQIIDNKTRNNSMVPRHADTLPSRLQLMLYHRLVSNMLAVGGSHLLDTWRQIGLDLSKPFSTKFKEELNIITVESGLSFSFLDSNCLEDIVTPFHDTIDALEIDREIDKSLFLVYRPRRFVIHSKVSEEPSPGKRKKSMRDRRSSDGKKMRTTPNSLENSPSTGDRGDPVACSTSPLTPTDDSPGVQSNESHISLNCTSDGSSTSDPSTASAPVSDPDSDTSQDSKNQLLQPPQKQPDIIGTKKFRFNEEMLMNHLRSVLKWWHGKRDAKGVDIGLTYRCNSCEYQQDCEWREMKAQEFATQKAVTGNCSSHSTDTQAPTDLDYTIDPLTTPTNDLLTSSMGPL